MLGDDNTLDWDAIDTVFLDMDGTLLDLHFDTFFWLEHLPKRYAEHHELAPEPVRQQLVERIIQEKGTLNWYCVDYWSDVFDIDIAALKREISHKIAFRPHVEDFLQALKEHDKRVVIVTNAHQKSLAIKLEKTGIDKLVDRIICSHDFNLPKEDQTFWDELQKVEPFDNGRTLFIDDNPQVLASAQEYGIRWLLTILQPDSQKPKNHHEDFHGIDRFTDIHPSKK